MKVPALWAALIGLSMGCAPKEVTRLNRDVAPAPPPPGGWRQVQAEGLGATFSAPREWMTMAEMKQAELEEMGGAFQGLTGEGEAGQEPSAMQAPPAAMGIGPADKEPGGAAVVELFKRGVVGEIFTPTKIRVTRTKAAGGAELKAEADKVASKFGKSTREALSLPIGPAEEIRAQIKTRDGETGHHIIYVLVDNEDVFQVALQTEQSEQIVSSIARPLIESFRLEP